MINIVFQHIRKTAFIPLVVLILAGCEFPENEQQKYGNESYYLDPFVFTDECKMIKVPVPEGGIDFPVGVDDDDTARVEKAYYIGETLVTFALYDTVSRWARTEKKYGKYEGLFYGHNEGYKNDTNPNSPVTGYFAVGHLFYLEGQTGYETLVPIDPFYVLPIWCNAFTEWYNEKYGTNFVPVYQDSYGNPIRYINNSEPFVETANPNATGFRLPTPEEWELAARWRGNDSVNTVTKTINDIDFSSQPIKFTRGNSSSGAKKSVDNFKENDIVAIWNINAGFLSDPISVKSKQPNALGIYDMSGNAWERTSSWEYYYLNSLNPKVVYSLCKGGSITSNYNELAVGNNMSAMEYTWGYVAPHNTGFRTARNAE